MKIDEKITVERTGSGCYKITLPDGTSLIGSAASTAVALAHVVFLEEASEGTQC